MLLVNVACLAYKGSGGCFRSTLAQECVTLRDTVAKCAVWDWIYDVEFPVYHELYKPLKT